MTMPDPLSSPDISDEELVTQFPAKEPNGRLLWTALVTVGDRIDLGPAPKGDRFMIPILGGRFIAGTVDPNLHGTVQGGGADRQLLRRDGVKELEAIYEMTIDNGPLLSICNKVLVDQDDAGRYAMSVIEVTAPEGPWAWLNKRLILGTLQSARPARPFVVVRAWMMEP